MVSSFLIPSYLYMYKISWIVIFFHTFSFYLGIDKHKQNKRKQYIQIHFMEEDFLQEGLEQTSGWFDSFLSQPTLSQANVISVMECSDHTQPCTHSLSHPLIGWDHWAHTLGASLEPAPALVSVAYGVDQFMFSMCIFFNLWVCDVMKLQSLLADISFEAMLIVAT